MSTSEKPLIWDPKKRALAALERRFAIAKSESQQEQQQKSKKRAHEDGTPNKKQSLGDPDKKPSSALEQKASDTFTPVSSSKKGHVSFSGSRGISEEEASGPAYAQLSKTLHENLLNSDIKLSSGVRGITDKVIHELLQNGDSAHKYMQGSRSIKIDNWVLLDGVVHGYGLSRGTRNGATHAHSKRSRRHMSMQQHRKCGSFNLPSEFHKFELFHPMHEMWKDYMTKFLEGNGKEQLAHRLLTADLHGSFLHVVDCKNTSLVGTSGIMIRETVETFGIITREDKFRVVPKKGSVFIFQAGCWKATLLGDKLSIRDDPH